MARARLTDGVLVSRYAWVLLASAMWYVQRMDCLSVCCSVMSSCAAACGQLSQLSAVSEPPQRASCWPAQALFRPAQLKALVDIHAAEEGLPEGYLSTGVSDLPYV